MKTIHQKDQNTTELQTVAQLATSFGLKEVAVKHIIKEQGLMPEGHLMTSKQGRPPMLYNVSSFASAQILMGKTVATLKEATNSTPILPTHNEEEKIIIPTDDTFVFDDAELAALLSDDI